MAREADKAFKLLSASHRTKVVLALRLRRETSMDLKWIARKLGVGSWRKAIYLFTGFTLLALLAAMGVLWQLHRDAAKLEGFFAAVPINASYAQATNALAGLHRSGGVVSSNAVAVERYYPGLLPDRYILLVVESNAVVHVSIRSWDRFDRVYSAKGSDVEYPGFPTHR